ncbi:hypothetical protein [Pseudomonas fluorescens]|nr:hypothetical protein [Pseudomonas fluorescens]
MTYGEVKKNKKVRFSKHFWPYDPFLAQATTRAKPKRT